jgi:hypothetical protein
MASLLKSRKFWLSVFGVVQVLILHFFQVPDPIWQAITALVMVLITSIAIEDAAEKRSDTYNIQSDEDKPEL